MACLHGILLLVCNVVSLANAMSLSNTTSLIQTSDQCHFNEKPHFQDKSSILLHVDAGTDYTFNFCNAVNYCHITWYKDDEELDMSDGHIIAMDQHNQGITLINSQLSDAGPYKCNVSNNVGSVIRIVTIVIVTGKICDAKIVPLDTPSDDPVIGKPYQKRLSINISLENPLSSFYKSIGTMDRWISDCSEVPDVHCCSVFSRNSSNEDQLLVTLHFKDIREDDLTWTYTLKVLSLDGVCQYFFEFELPKLSKLTEMKYRQVLTAVLGILFVIAVCIIIWRQINVDVWLIRKDYLGKQEVCDGRSYDVYISYTWSRVDRLFVLHLKSKLEKRGYRVYVPEIDNTPGDCTATQIAEALEQSRRFIMVLSPEYVQANFTAFEVNIFLEAVNKYKDYIIPVVFKGLLLPDDSAICRHIMKVTQTVKWANIDWPISEEYHDTAVDHGTNIVSHCWQSSKVSMEKSFMMRAYKELLLKLPPKPKKRTHNYLLSSFD